jgi:hypothetical protein
MIGGRSPVPLAVVLLLGLAGARSAPAEVPLAPPCTDCHPAGVARHLEDWDRSAHALAGVSCKSCHQPMAPAGPARPGDAELDSPVNILRVCGACHPEVVAVFSRSPHARASARAAELPSCGDCHTTAGGSILAEEQFAERCGACHRALDADERETASARALLLLAELRRVTLARIMVADALARRRQAGTPDPAAEEQLRRVDAEFRGITSEWHRFNLDAAGRDSRRALDLLERIHRALGEGR